MKILEHDDLIQTKLYRPPIPVDLIPRPRLTERLDLDKLPPLVLTSAPAGYGKSTLIKCLVMAINCPCAWIQLDEHDNELVLFLSYFLSAIQLIYPGTMDESRELLNGSSQPPLRVLTTSLINDLNQIKENYLLVLDDYHSIHQVEIHQLLDQILLHPPPSFHLVLSTRRDPLLPLARLRAHARIIEFRAEDLRFTADETQQLLEKMTESIVNDSTIQSIEEQTEGWVTGIRLAALAMRHRIGQGAFPGQLSLQNPYVTEYLVNEILSKQTALWSVCLLKTSILDRFNADLCNAVCFPEAESSDDRSVGLKLKGEQFLEWLQASRN
jgi:LuxR family maltose regulon positive regulatory protein